MKLIVRLIVLRSVMDSSHLEDETLDDTILTDDATSLMRKKLPSYVVNSFIATGYDTLFVIVELDNDGLEEIEEVINSDLL